MIALWGQHIRTIIGKSHGHQLPVAGSGHFDVTTTPLLPMGCFLSPPVLPRSCTIQPEQDGSGKLAVQSYLIPVQIDYTLTRIAPLQNSFRSFLSSTPAAREGTGRAAGVLGTSALKRGRDSGGAHTKAKDLCVAKRSPDQPHVRDVYCLWRLTLSSRMPSRIDSRSGNPRKRIPNSLYLARRSKRMTNIKIEQKCEGWERKMSLKRYVGVPCWVASAFVLVRLLEGYSVL